MTADRIQSLGAQPSRVLQSGVLSPKSTGVSGVRQEGFALPSRVQSQGGRAQGWRECAPPGEAPAPPAGILGMSPVRKATARLWAEGGIKPGISRVLLHKIPQAFQPRRVEAHRAEKESAYFSGPTLRLPIPNALPGRKDPFFVSEGGSPSANLLG